MLFPPEVVLSEVAGRAALEAAALDRIAGLAASCPRILRCRVVVEAIHQARLGLGDFVHVRLSIAVPGGEIVVRRAPSSASSLEDAATALRRTFDVAKRRLDEWSRAHPAPAGPGPAAREGRIARIDRASGTGLVRAAEGDDLRFWRDGVLDGGFDRLGVGDEVRFIADPGVPFPRASAVHPLASHLTIAH